MRLSILKDCRSYPNTELWKSFIEVYPEYKQDITNCFSTVVKPLDNWSGKILANPNPNPILTPTPLSPQLAEIFNTYENSFGVMGVYQNEQIKDFMDDGLTDDIFKQAISIASDNKKKTWSYTKGIIKNWIDSGKPAQVNNNGKSSKGDSYGHGKFASSPKPHDQYTDPDEYNKSKLLRKNKAIS